MTTEDLGSKIKGIVREQLGIKEDREITEKSTLDDLGADSLDKVELVMALETEFKIEILDEEAEKVRTVGDAVELIRAKQGA